MKIFFSKTIFLVLFSVSIFLVSFFTAKAATECENTYGGSCYSSCPADTKQVGSSFFGMVANPLGCPGTAPICCVELCAHPGMRPGAKCVTPDLCGKSAGKSYDCAAGETCCLQDSCSASGTYNCVSTFDVGQASCNDPGGSYSQSCTKFFGSSLATWSCCPKSNTSAANNSSTQCNSHQAEGYYCSSACNTGDTPISAYTCDSGQACCQKPGAVPPNPNGTGTTGTPWSQGANSPQGYNYASPLSATSFTQLLLSFMAGVQGVVGWLAVIALVIGGVMFIISAGTGMATTARNIITYALLGFALAVAAPSIMKEIWGLASSGGSAAALPQANSIQKILMNILNFLLSIVGMLSLIGFVISGILYVTSAGTAQADTAKKAATYSIIAIVVSGAGLIIVRQILALLYGQA